MSSPQSTVLETLRSEIRALAGEERFREAAERCKKVLSSLSELPLENPLALEITFLQGMLLARLGQRRAAASCFSRILQYHPGNVAACYHLGRLCHLSGDNAGAVNLLQSAVESRPDFAEAWYLLGNALYLRLRLAESAAAYRRALQSRPAFDDPHCYLTPPTEKLRRTYQTHFYTNLGRTQRKLGDLEAARASYEQALRIDPDNILAHSRLLFLLSFHVLCEPQALLAAHRQWDARHGAQGRAQAFHHARTGEAGKRLRIGYVSPDFHSHAVSYFFEPLIAHHDPQRVEVFCYADTEREDAVSRRLRGHAQHWRVIHGLSDSDVARRIHEDAVDILVDLAGHTTTRLRVFTYKPAPVQVTYLGYFATTGLAAMDYWLTDDVLHPADTVELASESLWRLPRCCLAYQPDAEAPPVAEPGRGAVTFGSFNQVTKVSPQAVALWSRVLKAVPGSRLLLKCQMLAEPAIRRRLIQAFAAQGIEAERLELLPYVPSYREHLALYGRIDILLDTVPRTGGSTTADALWMGVPVISLAGRFFVERLSATMLEAVGLGELVAATPEEYVAKAVALAQDSEKRRHLRQNLRRRMAASPLRDGQGLASAMEDAYHAMWRRWLHGGQPD